MMKVSPWPNKDENVRNLARHSYNKSDKWNVDSCMCSHWRLLSCEIMFSISFQHTLHFVQGMREKFRYGIFLNLIVLKLYPISIHSYEVVMHGINTEPVTGACLHVFILATDLLCCVATMLPIPTYISVKMYYNSFISDVQILLLIKQGLLPFMMGLTATWWCFMSSHDNLELST